MSPYEVLVEESASLLARVESGEALRDLAEEAKGLEARWRAERSSTGPGPRHLHTSFESNIDAVFSARNAEWGRAAAWASEIVAEAADLANWQGRIFTHFAADLRDRFFAVGDIGPTRKTLRAELEEAIAVAFSTLPRRRPGEQRAADGPEEEILAAADTWAALESSRGARARSRARR